MLSSTNMSDCLRYIVGDAADLGGPARCRLYSFDLSGVEDALPTPQTPPTQKNDIDWWFGGRGDCDCNDEGSACTDVDAEETDSDAAASQCSSDDSLRDDWNMDHDPWDLEYTDLMLSDTNSNTPQRARQDDTMASEKDALLLEDDQTAWQVSLGRAGRCYSVAERWGISVADAAEIVHAVDSAQTVGV